MAAAGWLRRAAVGSVRCAAAARSVRRAAAASLPRLPPGLPLIPPSSPALLTEVVPGHGAAAAPAMVLMAVPNKDRTSISEKSYAAAKVTNDGVTLVKSIEFNDRVNNIGSICNWENDTKGITEGCKFLAAGMNAMDLRRGTSMASDTAVANLKYMERMISASGKIAQVATLSDYWQRGISELIAKAMKKDGNTLHNDHEVVEGMKLDKCYSSPYFIAIQKYWKCNRKYLLFVTEDVESGAPCTSIIDKLCGCVKVCAVKAPEFGGTRKASLQNLDVLTGEVTISNDDNIILAGAGDKKAIEDKAYKIDGTSEHKVCEKDGAIDAQNSTKAAVPEKLVAAGMNAMDLRHGMTPSSLCRPIFTTKGCKYLAAGKNVMDLQRGVMWTTPVKRVAHGYHTTSQSPHPHLVTFESASNYFLRGQKLVVHVPDINHDLYKLVKYNKDSPILLTESAKLLSRSLVESVLTLHDHNLCLKDKLDLDSLLVSSLGTFKLPNTQTTTLTEKGRSDDLTNVSSVLMEMMISAHTQRVVQYVPKDYCGLLNALKNPAASTNFIRYHPAHLPATTYGMAFMKLHGLLMWDGLAAKDYFAAVDIVDDLPYQDGSDMWTITAQNNVLLDRWLKHRPYFASNHFHIMEFGRNVMGGHPLEQRGIAAGFLPPGSPPYSEEAVNILFQHSYPKLLPDLMELVLSYFEKKYPAWIRSHGFENLFPGVPPYYLNKE